jgi:hypothetical protein
MLDNFTFLSLVLSPAKIILCLLVLTHWLPVGWKSFKAGSLKPHDWLIVGVVVGFGGEIFDDIYWLFAWHFDYTSHPLRDWFFTHGSVSNVFSRQIAGILSAICHIISAYLLIKSQPSRSLMATMSVCIVAGLIYAGVLISA